MCVWLIFHLLVNSPVGSTSQVSQHSYLQGPRGNSCGYHQGVPKDSTCLHNRLKDTTKGVKENDPKQENEYLDPPWAMVEYLLMLMDCAKRLQSLEIDRMVAFIWQTSLFYTQVF